MIVLDRLKMELSNQSYFPDEQYIQFLVENGLTPTDNYDKATMQRQLLFTVLDVFEAVANDMDTMSAISTEFVDIGQAYQFIEARISQIKDKIASIPDPEEEYNCFSLMFTREDRRNYTPARYGKYVISNDEIDDIVNS